MSTLFYNGITLEVVKTLSYQRQFVYDGPQYLWTRHRIAVQGIFNPQATSYAADDDDPARPLPVKGYNPAATDAIIRHRLAQPQKKLVYSMAPAPARDAPNPPGSHVVLECPPPQDPGTPNFSTDVTRDRYLTDANNGPRPFHLNVREILGTKTWWVEFGVEASVNECHRSFERPPILLSHLWRMRSNMDRDGFTTRHVSGHYVFRTDALLDQDVTPDDFRDVLAHPIPPNFERRGVVTEQSEDGNRVEYQFLDREVSHNLTVRNVTRLEAFVQVGQAIPSPEGSLRGFANELIRSGGRAIRGASARALVGLLPVGSVRLVIRVWGNRFSRRAALLDTAARVLAVKFPQGIENRQNRGPFAEDVDVTMDLMGRFVEVQAAYTSGPFGNALAVAANAQLGDVFPDLFEMEVGDVATRLERPGRGPVPGTVVRGSYLGALVAQLLKEPCAYPSYPPRHTPYDERSLPPTA